ncbi:MAG: hypothetical protein HY735_25370 [Verrucomicrobia bacterium]|nr:hypothetical protein [Verrucomicrobiota bacterium]
MSTPNDSEPAVRTQAEAERDVRQRLPSAGDVARIAATLADGENIDEQTAEKLAQAALLICEASARAIDKRVNALTAREMRIDQIEAENLIVPVAKSYPVSLDEFLRLIVGGKSTDRLHRYRQFLADSIRKQCAISHEPEPSESDLLGQVAKIVERDQREPLTHGEYLGRAASFLQWRAMLPSLKASHAAKKRHQKKPVDTNGLPEKRDQAGIAQGASTGKDGASSRLTLPKQPKRRRKQT